MDRDANWLNELARPSSLAFIFIFGVAIAHFRIEPVRMRNFRVIRPVVMRPGIRPPARRSRVVICDSLRQSRPHRGWWQRGRKTEKLRRDAWPGAACPRIAASTETAISYRPRPPHRRPRDRAATTGETPHHPRAGRGESPSRRPTERLVLKVLRRADRLSNAMIRFSPSWSPISTDILHGLRRQWANGPVSQRIRAAVAREQEDGNGGDVASLRGCPGCQMARRRRAGCLKPM